MKTSSATDHKLKPEDGINMKMGVGRGKGGGGTVILNCAGMVN